MPKTSHLALNHFISTWHILPDSLHLLREAQNIIYEAKTAKENIILRISSADHRNQAQLLTEIAWMNYLLKHAFPVDAPIPYAQAQWVSEYGEGREKVYAVCFKKIDGDFVNFQDKAICNQQTQQSLGELLGQLHILTNQFSHTYPVNRYNWDQEEVFLKLPSMATIIPENIYQHINTHLATLKKYPTNSDNFGLIHNDFRLSNWIKQKDTIYVIDFDQGCLHWKVNDFAHLIFATFIHPRIALPKQTTKDAISFAKNILIGFGKYSHFSKADMQLVPALIRLRIMLAYLFEALVPDSGDLSGSYMDTQEAKQILATMIVKGHPLMAIDYTALCYPALG